MQATTVLVLGGQGYIGSALTAHLLSAGFLVQSVDLGWRGTPCPALNQRRSYQELSCEDLAAFDNIVLLAGHSSVPACERDPAGAFANNVAGFIDLIHKLQGQKLIYASSISVYIDTHGQEASEDELLPVPVSYYDLHKQALERYAALAYPGSYGLRFGTVCGPSPNTRSELLLNSLVLSALRQESVQVANRQAHRPLLGINDLCRAVEAVIREAVPPGVYNLASANTQIGALAELVAHHLGVPCHEIERPNQYDIQVDTRKFRSASGLEFQDSIPNLIESLKQLYSATP